MQPSNKVLVAQNNILDRIAAVRRGEGGEGREGRGREGRETGERCVLE